DLLELTRGNASRVIVNATELSIALKGLPLAYNKDLQETQEPLFQYTETMVSLMPLVMKWMKSVEFNYPHMQEAAQTGFMNAWAAATYLVQRGVPFRQAHEHIGKAVRLALENGCELKDLALEELQTLNPAFDQNFYACLNFQAVLAVHDVPGGTAPSRVKHAIADTKKRIEAIREDVHANA